MSKKLNKVFMAFATGKESTEGASVKRYIGIGFFRDCEPACH